MIAAHRERVGHAFDAASDYARFATVQRRIAAELAKRVVELDIVENPAILEIGCGTGFLTRELLDRGISGRWLITDKAPKMLERCRELVGAAPDRRFSVLDGEYGVAARSGRYDLICASMAVQWFENLEAAVERLIGALNPGGHLVFNTLAAGTFSEWHEAHRKHGLLAGIVPFPPLEILRERLARFSLRGFDLDRHVVAHESARDFVGGLKLIGAATACSGHRPLPPHAMRRVMATFDDMGARATYEVVTCHFVKEGAV